MAVANVSPRKSCLKISSDSLADSTSKKVFFDEIFIKEYPIILGDNPAVSSGAPITIGWKPSNESVVDLDFYEYCRAPERKSRKKMILSVRRRANFLLSSGYSLDQIANATMEVEQTKKYRAESLKSAGFSNPWELLSGAVETTGTTLKRFDVLGVGTGVGLVVGAGVTAGKNVQDISVQTTRMLVTGVQSSSRAVTDKVVRPVGAAMNGAVVKPIGKVGKTVTTGMVQSGKAIGNGISKTGRAIVSIVAPGTVGAEPVKTTPRASDPGAALSPPPRMFMKKRSVSIDHLFDEE